jgi:hypothetical protein
MPAGETNPREMRRLFRIDDHVRLCRIPRDMRASHDSDFFTFAVLTCRSPESRGAVIQHVRSTAGWMAVLTVSYEEPGNRVTKLIGYARCSDAPAIHRLATGRHLAAGVRHDDLYVDRGISGARASRPDFDRALDASRKAILSSSRLSTGWVDRRRNMLRFRRGAPRPRCRPPGAEPGWRQPGSRSTSRNIPGYLLPPSALGIAPGPI